MIDARAGRRLVLAVLVALGVLAGAALGAKPASAHGGAGEISVVDASLVEPQVVELEVEIRYVLDQHPAAPATFVVSGTGPTGEVLESQQLEATDEEGVYTSRLDLPADGRWTLTFQSSLPPATLEQAVEVDVAGVSLPDGEAPPATPSSAVPSSLFSGEELVESGGSGPPSFLILGLVISALVAVVVVLLVVRASRSRT